MASTGKLSFKNCLIIATTLILGLLFFVQLLPTATHAEPKPNPIVKDCSRTQPDKCTSATQCRAAGGTAIMSGPRDEEYNECVFPCTAGHPELCTSATCKSPGQWIMNDKNSGSYCYFPPSSNNNSKPGPCTKKTFFGLAPWYQYLTVKQDPVTKHCEVDFKASQLLGKASPILLIIMAVIDDLLRVAGMVAVVFIVIGGFKFITSAGEPETAASGKKTITYALIGLVISLVAVVIVSFIGSSLGA